MRLIAFSIEFMVGCALWAQPTFNKRYTFGSENSTILHVHAVDSCYFITGGLQNLGGEFRVNNYFGKVNFSGNIEFLKVYDFDTVWSSQGWTSNLLSTKDNELITQVSFYDYTGVFCFSPEGDTIWTYIFTDNFFIDNLMTTYDGKLLQRNDDSSFVGVISLINPDSFEKYVQMFKISKNGELIFKQNIPQVSGYEQYIGMDIIELIDGYLISCNFHDNNIEENQRYYTHLIKTDLLGNVVTQKTLTDNPYEYAGTGLTQTSDGGFVYAGINGSWSTEGSALLNANYVVKLDENLDKEWGLTLGESYGGTYTMIYKLIQTSENEFVAIGKNPYFNGVDWDINAEIIKFNLNREILWKSRFSLVEPVDGYGKPKHRFYDGVQTPDGGFILVGDIDDPYSGITSDTTYYSWIVKTDSFGCLVPGCQDVLSTNTSADHFKFSIYPNPTTDYLNLYYNTATFSEYTTAELYSIQGQHLQSWRLSQNNTTYMLDIQGIPPGTYVLNLIENGSLLQSEKVVIGG